jgi:hypothetical protein
VPGVVYSKEQELEAMEKAAQEVIEMRRISQVTKEKYQEPDYDSRLWLVVNRFRRMDADSKTTAKAGGTTLFFAHANGFHKEVCPVSGVQ